MRLALWFPKIRSDRIRAMIESGHHRIRCLPYFTCLAPWSPTCSNRQAGLKLRIFLRHQLNIALRRGPQRLRLRGSERTLLAWMTLLWPSLLGLARVVQPDTILRWHRAGFRGCWRWKSHGRPGRPRVCRELRDLIRRMSKKSPLWGAPRIHGELLKLGYQIADRRSPSI
jgi:hypothetical protein